MKWQTNGISFKKGNFTPVAFKPDNCKVWLTVHACCSTQLARTVARKVGQAYGSKMIEVMAIQPGMKLVDVITTDTTPTGVRFVVEYPVPVGCKRDVRRVADAELFM